MDIPNNLKLPEGDKITKKFTNFKDDNAKKADHFYMPFIFGKEMPKARMENKHFNMTPDELRKEGQLPEALIKIIEETSNGNFPPKMNHQETGEPLNITEWIEERKTGIKSRPVADPAVDSVGSLATKATINLIHRCAKLGIDLKNEKLILGLSTSSCKTVEGKDAMCTDEKRLSAIIKQVRDDVCDNLGIPRENIEILIPLDNACTGFLGVVEKVIEQMKKIPEIRKAIVVSSETLTYIADYGNPLSNFLFSDGAKATLLTKDQLQHNGKKIKSLVLYAGLHHLDKSEKADNMIHIPTEDKNLDTAKYRIRERKGTNYLDGNRVFFEATKRMLAAAVEVAQKYGIPFEEVSATWFHQANARIINAIINLIADKLNLPKDEINVPIRMRLGNSGSLTLLSLMSTLMQEGGLDELNENDWVVLSALGMGIHTRAMLARVVGEVVPSL